jgi:hypothetical protein
MGLFLLRIFAAVFVLTVVVAMMTATELGKMKRADSPNRSWLSHMFRVLSKEHFEPEAQSLHRRFRLCFALSWISFFFVFGSIFLAMND